MAVVEGLELSLTSPVDAMLPVDAVLVKTHKYGGDLLKEMCSRYDFTLYRVILLYACFATTAITC
jgi:hypothetical protein